MPPGAVVVPPGDCFLTPAESVHCYSETFPRKINLTITDGKLAGTITDLPGGALAFEASRAPAGGQGDSTGDGNDDDDAVCEKPPKRLPLAASAKRATFKFGFEVEGIPTRGKIHRDLVDVTISGRGTASIPESALECSRIDPSGEEVSTSDVRVLKGKITVKEEFLRVDLTRNVRIVPRVTVFKFTEKVPARVTGLGSTLRFTQEPHFRWLSLFASKKTRTGELCVRVRLTDVVPNAKKLSRGFIYRSDLRRIQFAHAVTVEKRAFIGESKCKKQRWTPGVGKYHVKKRGATKKTGKRKVIVDIRKPKVPS